MPTKSTPNYREMRARLLEAGYTLRSFAVKFGYKAPTVYCAAKGTRAGVKTTQIRKHLEEIAYAQ